MMKPLSYYGTKPKTLQDRYEELVERVVKTASLICPGHAIKEKVGKSWCVDLETNTLYWNPLDPLGSETGSETISDEEFLACLTHESGHIKHSSIYQPPPGLTMNDRRKLEYLVNAAEDARVDKIMSIGYPGFVSIRQKMYDRAVEIVADKTWGLFTGFQRFVYRQLLKDTKFQPTMNDTDKYNQQFDGEYWEAVRTAKNTKELCDKLFPLLAKIHEDPDNNQDEPAEDESGQTNMDTQDESEQPTGGAGAKHESPLDSMLKALTDNYQNHRGSWEDPKKQELEAALREIYNKATQKDIESTNRMVEEDNPLMVGAGDGSPEHTSSTLTNWEIYVNDNKMHIQSLVNSLKTRLEKNASEQWVGGAKRGKINVKKAFRLQAGNTRVFRNKSQPDTPNYIFGIGVDTSSSMHSSRDMYEAAKYTVILCEAVEKLGFEYFLAPWNNELSSYSSIPFGPKSLRKKTLAINHVLSPSGGTQEFRMLKPALKAFQSMGDESNKVFINLTDGQTSNLEESRKLLAEMKRNGIFTIGLGIRNAVPMHYARTVSCETPQELLRKLPGILSEYIRHS